MSNPFSGRAANDRFSGGGVLPRREPRRQGVVDTLGGEDVANDIEQKSVSL